jgi:hypothetical protein
VDPRAGLDYVEKRKFLTVPGLELRPLGCPARSQPLYRLSYPGSMRIIEVVGNTVFAYIHVVDGHSEQFCNNVDFRLRTLPTVCFFLVFPLHSFTSALKKEVTCSSETVFATQKTVLSKFTIVRT